jgi:acetyl esterase/lipase
MASASAIYDPSRSHDLDIQDVEYFRSGDTGLLARIYQPKGAGPFPALVYLHGGAWSSNDRTTNPAVPQGVAASGVVVCSLDFRQGAEGPYPASSADINYGIRWLKAHAAQFKALPETIGCMGSSSGGHLTLLAGMRPADPRYACLPLSEAPDLDATLAYAISCCGVLDPWARYVGAKRAGNAGMVERHDAYFRSDEAQQESSPVLIVERDEQIQFTPTLIVQGTADTTSPTQMVKYFESMFRAAGGDVEVAFFEDMPHGFYEWPEAEAQRAIARIKAYIADRVAAVAIS